MKYDDPRGATNSKHTDLRSAINCVNSPALMAPAGHYSHMCIAAGQIFISGQLPITPDGTALTGHSFEEQTTRYWPISKPACRMQESERKA